MTHSRHRRAAVVLAAVIVAQLAVLALVWRDARSNEIHDVPVAISAPAIVAESLATEVNELPGRPFDARFSRTDSEARRSVIDGVVVAAIAVDLTSNTDTLYVATAQGDTLVDAVIDKVRAIEGSRGRAIDVSDTVPARSGDHDLRLARALAFTWIVIGFAATATVAFVKGTRSPSRRKSLVRLFAMAVLSIAAGLVGAVAAGSTYEGHLLPLCAIGALTVFTAGVTTMAFQSLFGLNGIGIATVVFLMLAGPDYIASHPLLLPQPWLTLDPWVPHGATSGIGVHRLFRRLHRGQACVDPHGLEHSRRRRHCSGTT